MSSKKIKKRNKSNVYCCVPQCNTYYEENVSFHKFPTTNKQLRFKWIHALRIGKTVSPSMLVCSKHFRDEDFFFNRQYVNQKFRLKKNVVPSQSLPKISHETPHICNEGLIIQRQIRLEKRENLRGKCEEEKLAELMNSSEASVIENSVLSQAELEAANILMMISNNPQKNEHKQVTYEDKGVQVNTYEEFNQFDVTDMIDTDYKLRILTGVQNIALLNVLIEAVLNCSKSKSKWNVKKFILLCLMRLKLDIPFTALSIFFKVSPTTAQTQFRRVLKNLALCMKCFIRFPSKEEIQSRMPICFKEFSNTRIVLDCTEIEVQKCRCLKCRIKAYSFYKGRHTIKFLVGSTPSGLISFISKPYGGRASDKCIFNKENLISKLSPGDAIMVDKGFLIEQECAEKKIVLIRPPFLKKKKQLSKGDAIKTAKIARARVHIERVIQRIKTFRICKNVLPWKMTPYVNNIMIVIVALTNLSKPILSNDKF